MSLGYAFPNLEAISNARAAAVKVFEIIDLKSAIDVTSTVGKTLDTLSGVIHFKDVHFRYPARPDVQVQLLFLSQLRWPSAYGQTR